MKNINENTVTGFIKELSSKEPVPGGGGASALFGAAGAALCSMAANLTSGKKKYAEYQADIEKIIERTKKSVSVFLDLIEEDAKVFEPLSEAYSIPKDDSKRDEILEAALYEACLTPMKILKETADITGIVEELAQKGSKLVISDVGVAAAACRAAAEGAVMNIYINTKLMKNRERAKELNAEAKKILHDTEKRCGVIYTNISNELREI